MRPRERRETSEQDLFRSRLDQIIDMNHALVKLARAIDWRFLEQRFGAVYTDKPGQPPLPTRLMAGVAILKHTYDLSDEALCDRWVENPYFQYFCGEEFFNMRWCLTAPPSPYQVHALRAYALSLRQSGGPWTTSDVHYVQLNGSEQEVVALCEQYVDYLTKFVQDFIDKHPE
jgi:Transposase domain (DUF772)